MAGVVVVGAQWGDEGKGKIVDWLSSRADTVVRFQGGHNAGHTLVIDGKTFKLALLPSGLVRGGKLSVIGNGVVVDPWHMLTEIAGIREQGVEVSPETLVLADNASLILPWHKDIDAAREGALGAAQIGTTKRGIGPAYEDRVGRRAIRVADLADPAALDLKIERLLAHHNALRRGLGIAEIDGVELLKQLTEIAPQVLPYADTVWALLDAQRRAGKRILFEGAQGALLDVDHGTYPFVTSSNPTAGGASVGSGIGPNKITRVIGILKAYTTRVGSGPFPTELHDGMGEFLRKTGGEVGVNTGRARRCGWFDAVIGRYAVRVNGITDLFLTKLDVLSGLESVPICVGYEVDGHRVDEMPMTQTGFHHAVPVYEEMPGWVEDLSGARTWEDLPPAARAYVQRIEELPGAPVSAIGVGPGRDQTITR